MSAVYLRRDDSLSACGRKTDSTAIDRALVTCRHCLRRIAMAKRPPPEPEPTPLPVPSSFFRKIAGVTFANQDGSFRQDIIPTCRIGERLDLVRQPTLRIDPEGAIKVMRMNGQQLGHVPAHVSRGGNPNGLAARMDSSEQFWCRISDITGGGPYRSYGVNIEVSNVEFTGPLPDEVPEHLPEWFVRPESQSTPPPSAGE